MNITVKELIEILSKFDPDMEVWAYDDQDYLTFPIGSVQEESVGDKKVVEIR